MYTVHGRGADLPFFLRFGNDQYWYRLIDSIAMRNPTTNELAIFT